MAYLSWIEDSALVDCIQGLINTARNKKANAKKNLDRNVMDPFSAIFQMAGFDMNYTTWIDSEEARQAQKSLQNHIGSFHENILGSVQGWENLGVGEIIDLVCHERKIIAELKNKHNTVKKSDLSKLYQSLHDEVMHKSSKYKSYTAYYVTILPARPVRFDHTFVPSDSQVGARVAPNENIRAIDGASFYELVTGRPDAIVELFEVIPKITSEKLGIRLSSADKRQLKSLFSSAFQ